MKKIVLTGATSMLGLALINECLKNGIHVRAIIRRNSKKRLLLPISDLISITECNIDELGRLVLTDEEKSDVFYHFAWDVSVDNGRENGRDAVDRQYANVLYTLDAIRLAKRLGCKKFIGAGSQAEYGRKESIIKTDIHVSPENAYGTTKFAAGKLSSILAEQMGLEFVWARIFSVYGVHDSSSTMLMYVIDSLLKGERPSLTPCEQLWDYMNSRDAAIALKKLGECECNHKIYNIGGGQARPLSEYVYTIRNAINPNLLLGIGDKEYSKKQVMHLCAGIADLHDDTGFKPQISFEDGITEVINWRKKVLNLQGAKE